MKKHLEADNKALPLVIPLVLYHGRQSPYPYSLNLYDCFENPNLARQWLFEDFNLIDLTTMRDSEVLQHKRAAILEMVQKYIFARDIMKEIKSLQAAFECISIYPNLNDPVQDVVYYLLKVREIPNAKAFIEKLTESVTDYEDDIMTGAEQLINEGIEKGIEKGIKRGHLDMVKNFIQQGVPEDIIMNASGLSHEELARLSKHSDTTNAE